MKKLVLGISILSASLIVAAECSTTEPRFCVGESVFLGTTPSTIEAISNNEFRVRYTSSNTLAGSLHGASELSKTKGCGNSTPRFCINEQVYLGSAASTIVGIRGSDYQLLFNRSGSYAGSLHEAKELAKISGCSTTNPRFCVGEHVLLGTTPSKLVAILADGSFELLYETNSSLSGSYHSPSELTKLKNGCADGPNGFCAGDLGTSSPVSPETIADNFFEITFVVPEQKAALFKRLSDYSRSLNWEVVQDMLIVLGAKYTTASTSDVMKNGFAPAYTAALKALPAGIQDFSSIEPSKETLVVALEVLRAAVEQNLHSATPAPEATAMMGRLTGIAAETRFLDKALRLRRFVQDYSEILLAEIQDPHAAGIAAMTQVVMTWISQM